MGSPRLQLSRVHLWVRNLQDSVAFYCGLFGLEPAAPAQPSDRVCICRSTYGTDESGGELVLTQGLPMRAELLGVDHFSFEVPRADEVEFLYRKAKDQGYRATQPRMYAGYWQTFVFDPDGYKIEVFTHDRPARGVASEDIAAGKCAQT